MEKKPYTRPTLTDHGSVVAKTKGMLGGCFEPIGQMVWDCAELDGFAPEQPEKK